MTARNPSVPVKRPATAVRSSARPLGSSEPPETTTLAARTLGVLRSDILSLKLAPGSKLLLAGLCETYKVGLSPLREALSRLVVQGLVVGEDHRGFWVTPLTEEDFYDLTFVRREIESMAVARSVERGDDRWEAELTRAFTDMSAAVSEQGKTVATWTQRHEVFHEALVSACGSPRLIQLRRQLFDQFMRYQRIAPRHVWIGAARNAEHQQIMDAAVARDVDACKRLVRAHIKVLDVIVDAVRAHRDK